MRNILVISITILFSLQAFCDGLFRIGQSQQKIIAMEHSVEGGIHALSASQSGDIYYKIYQGTDWLMQGKINEMPKIGLHNDTLFSIVDFNEIAGALYILGKSEIVSTGESITVLFEYNNKKWTELNSPMFKECIKPNKIIEYEGYIQIIGQFESQGFNIMKYIDASWRPVGNNLTLINDEINDVIVYKEKIYTAGLFTKTGTKDQLGLAVFSGIDWQFVSLPPFIGESYRFKNISKGLLLYGAPNTKSDYFKYYDGLLWNDLNNGLDKINVLEVSDIEEFGDKIAASGKFLSNGKGYSLIIWNGTKWTLPNIDYSGKITSLEVFHKELILGGDFQSDQIEFTARFSNHRVLNGYVFNDLNANCVQDSNQELGLSNVTVKLSPGNHYFQTDADGYFQIPVNSGTYSLDILHSQIWTTNCRTFSFNTTDSTFSKTKTIGLQPVPNVADLKVDFIMENGWKIDRAVKNSYKIRVSNNGNTNVDSCFFELILPDWWATTDFDPQPDKANDGKFTWNIGKLNKDSSFLITLNAFLKPGKTKLEGAIDYRVFTSGAINDVVSKNDIGTETSFEILDNIPPFFKQSQYTHTFPINAMEAGYNIRFKNITGRTVNNIIVRDTLDKKLFIKRFEITNFMEATNVKVNYELQDNGNYQYNYTWVFSNSQLADSSDDYSKSIGFVQVKLDLASGFIKQGMNICNQAKINFENNEPIKTNKVCNTVGYIGLEKQKYKANISVYPNPVNHKLTIANSENKDLNLSFVDPLGREVYSFELNSFEKKHLDVSSLSKGVYFILIDNYSAIKVIVH